MDEVTRSITNLEEAIQPLKEHFDNPQIGRLGRALKAALADEPLPSVAKMLLELDRATKRVVQEVIYEEIGYSQIRLPKALAKELEERRLAEYATVMNMSVRELLRLMPQHILEQLLRKLSSDKFLPKSVSVQQLEEDHLTTPLYLAAENIRRRRKLRGRTRKE